MQGGGDWNRTNNHVLQTGSRPCFSFPSKSPNEVVAETIVMGDVVPAGSWDFYQDLPTRKKGYRQ
jgi:hypothetical protein